MSFGSEKHNRAVLENEHGWMREREKKVAKDKMIACTFCNTPNLLCLLLPFLLFNNSNVLMILSFIAIPSVSVSALFRTRKMLLKMPFHALLRRPNKSAGAWAATFLIAFVHFFFFSFLLRFYLFVDFSSSRRQRKTHFQCAFFRISLIDWMSPVLLSAFMRV